MLNPLLGGCHIAGEMTVHLFFRQLSSFEKANNTIQDRLCTVQQLEDECGHAVARQL